MKKLLARTLARTLARIPMDPTQMCCPVLAPRRMLELRELAGRLRALGDETRLQILGLLLAAEQETLCACHIEERFDLSQPTISHHLKILRDAGLVTSERRGSWVFYRLERAALRSLTELGALFQESLRR